MSLRELVGKNFFIPSYQRGYRWTLQQVKDLIDDLKDFTEKDDKKDYEFYCLQPVVVKKMSHEDKTSKGLEPTKDWFEVIDGQQRLTTLLLILNSYKDVFQINNFPTSFYKMVFEREMNIENKLLDNVDSITAVEDDTIDHLHISQAYLYILKRRKEEDNVTGFADTLLKYKLDNFDPPRDKAINARIIWYEAVDENPIEVFTRLNIGKISLTNAELIKALLLNSSNFDYKTKKHIKLRQQEIATEWDKIESTLQDDSFWHFLHSVDYSKPTRIDFILEIIKVQNLLQLTPNEIEECGTDDYATFRYFYIYFAKNNNEVAINECWEYVKKYFNTFLEWYNDIELYHYMGFLMYYKNKDLHQFVREWEEVSNKVNFKEKVKAKIMDKIRHCLPVDRVYNNQRDAFDLLFFHNIQTSINHNKVKIKGSRADMYRFPFNLLKKENWDVEHINSNTTNTEENPETKEEWLVNVYLSVSEELQEKIGKYFQNKKQQSLDEIFNEIKRRLPQIAKWETNDKNMIWNYTLLDSHTNRSYGNAIFSAKRRIIIDKDRGKETDIPTLKDGKLELATKKKRHSTFVPPVTKQVFMKYYSPIASDNNYWDRQIDAKGYLNDIEECIDMLTPANPQIPNPSKTDDNE